MENHNILDYSAPEQAGPVRFMANTGLRIANYFLDRIGAAVVMYALIFLGVFIDEQGGAGASLGFLFMLVGFASYVGYFVVFEHFFGKTPAKFLTKTMVVTVDGKRPSFWNIVGRSLCRFIPFEPFSFFFSNINGKPNGWHDSISKTLVVEDSYRQQMMGDYV